MSGSPATADESRMALVSAYLESMDELRAEFLQEIIDVDETVIERASGSVSLKKPGQFRWDYREPYERVIVADGIKVWLYEADLEQVTIRDLNADVDDTPAALLTGSPAALDQFEFVTSWMRGELEWVQLEPKAREADFASVDLGFLKDELVQLEFIDRLGQRTRIVFSEIDRAPSLAADEFEFEIPEGADVIGTDDI